MNKVYERNSSTFWEVLLFAYFLTDDKINSVLMSVQ